jgi:metal-sulfur cluster biosynthetic enzyme
MNLTSEVEKALKQVIDPETGMDVMRMQLVKNIKTEEDGNISLVFSPSSPTCPLAFQLALSIQDAIKKIQGVTKTKIDVDGYVRAEELENILRDND